MLSIQEQVLGFLVHIQPKNAAKSRIVVHDEPDNAVKSSFFVHVKNCCTLLKAVLPCAPGLGLTNSVADTTHKTAFWARGE